MAQPSPDLTAITPPASGQEVIQIREKAKSEGGRSHDRAHSNREFMLDLPGRVTGKMKPTAVEKCTCNRSALVTLPHTGDNTVGQPALITKDDDGSFLACVVCDAVNIWPRYNQEAA